MKFKVGDKVRRIDGIHGGMREGDVDVISKIESHGLYLKEYSSDGSHDPSMFELVSSNYKPKVPTHLVVWEIKGCGDPTRFFTSEKEAKDFTKELSEKLDVDKESIILVEIKSAQKVNITRNVRLMNYKV